MTDTPSPVPATTTVPANRPEKTDRPKHPIETVFFAPPFDNSIHVIHQNTRLTGHANPITLPWMIFTDGRMALFIQRPSDLPPPDEKVVGKTAIKLLDTKLMEGSTPLVTTLATIHAWTGEVDPPNVVVCTNCGGDGLCNRCECKHEHDCGICDGTGKVTEYDIRYGVIAGQVADMNRIARLLDSINVAVEMRPTASAEAAGCRVTTRMNNVGKNSETRSSGPTPMLRFDNGDENSPWVAMLMPLDAKAAAEQLKRDNQSPEMPIFTTPAAATEK